MNRYTIIYLLLNKNIDKKTISYLLNLDTEMKVIFFSEDRWKTKSDLSRCNIKKDICFLFLNIHVYIFCRKVCSSG